jgi:hypothetical protein
MTKLQESSGRTTTSRPRAKKKATHIKFFISHFSIPLNRMFFKLVPWYMYSKTDIFTLLLQVTLTLFYLPGCLFQFQFQFLSNVTICTCSVFLTDMKRKDGSLVKLLK